MLYLIIGAAFQGKLAYAGQQYRQLSGCDEFAVSDGAATDLEDSLSSPLIDHLHEMLRRLPADEADFQAAVTDWLDKLAYKLAQYPGQLQIIILDEIGGGLIPMDAGDRLWRERCGRLGCRLAELAGRVDRIWCGLPVVLKDQGRAAGLAQHARP